MRSCPQTSSHALEQYDAVVVGAGPYGLSTAAHLLGRGLRVAVFGKTLELWRQHMPQGMSLRSHWWASNLSDPGKRFGFDRFFRESRHKKGYPIAREAFIDYGHWFQERAVPNVVEAYVESVEHQDGGFVLTLDGGRKVHSAAVVMALGLRYYAHRPEPYSHLPSELVSHSCEHSDLGHFQGKQVVVIGGGQSAIEYAALIREAGATVHVVSRRPIQWLARDREAERSVLERVLAPTASIAPGWINWALDHLPYLFYRLPEQTKNRALRAYFTPTASAWLRDRVNGRVTLHEGMVRMDERHGRLDVVISDGETLKADHMILATGYKVDINKLTMIHPALRGKIKTDQATPLLSPWFESSVPGLYFVGLTSLRAFGPLFRFVAGCKAAAERVAKSVTWKSASPSPASRIDLSASSRDTGLAALD
jgi:cation diffusion facilitator CzcD-associated flavoprotein CzcO